MMLKKRLKLIIAFLVLGIILPNMSSAVLPMKLSDFERKQISDLVQKQKSDWQYYKNFSFRNNLPSGAPLIKVVLDQEILSKSKEGLGDLRITDSAGRDVPYKLIVERSIFTQENIYPIVVLDNSYSIDGGYNVFIVDFGQARHLDTSNSLNIITSSENFKRTVEVSGSDDMLSWNLLRENGYIYDYTDKMGNFKAQNTAVSYPENAFRYIRVKIFKGNDDFPLTITGAQVSQIKKSENKEMVFKPLYSVKENSAKKTTEVVVDLGKKGWPTSNIILESPNENFNRGTAVYESSDKNNWRRVGQGYIFNYNTPKFIGANLEIGYLEINERYLKLEILNGDDRPIAITGLSAKTILRSIVFQREQIYSLDDYVLYYGNPKANFPEYDFEKVFPYLDTGIYFDAVLSAEQVNPYYAKEAEPLPPLSERIPYLVPAALVLSIMVMALIILRFLKKVGADK